jgi:hypothetical protein
LKKGGYDKYSHSKGKYQKALYLAFLKLIGNYENVTFSEFGENVSATTRIKLYAIFKYWYQ